MPERTHRFLYCEFKKGALGISVHTCNSPGSISKAHHFFWEYSVVQGFPIQIERVGTIPLCLVSDTVNNSDKSLERTSGKEFVTPPRDDR